MKKQNRKALTIMLWCVMLVTALQFVGCSSTIELASAWKRTDMAIDGNQNDWEDNLYTLKKANVTIGIRNDNKNLYLCFISMNKGMQRQIMRGGFTVWFDPAGGTEETYGIQFPVEHTKGGMPSAFGGGDSDIPPSGDTTKNGSSGFNRNRMDGGMSSAFNDAQSEIRFLGPKKDDVQLSTMIELRSVKVRIGTTRQAFVYELQVPLQKTTDFPFTLTPTNSKNVLGVEFKTETGTSSDEMDGPGKGDMGGGRGGMRGPGGGGMGGPDGDMGGQGGGRRGEFNAIGSIELWTKVSLAQE